MTKRLLSAEEGLEMLAQAAQEQQQQQQPSPLKKPRTYRHKEVFCAWCGMVNASGRHLFSKHLGKAFANRLGNACRDNGIEMPGKYFWRDKTTKTIAGPNDLKQMGFLVDRPPAEPYACEKSLATREMFQTLLDTIKDYASTDGDSLFHWIHANVASSPALESIKTAFADPVNTAPWQPLSEEAADAASAAAAAIDAEMLKEMGRNELRAKITLAYRQAGRPLDPLLVSALF